MPVLLSINMARRPAVSVVDPNRPGYDNASGALWFRWGTVAPLLFNSIISVEYLIDDVSIWMTFT